MEKFAEKKSIQPKKSIRCGKVHKRTATGMSFLPKLTVLLDGTDMPSMSSFYPYFITGSLIIYSIHKSIWSQVVIRCPAVCNWHQFLAQNYAISAVPRRAFVSESINVGLISNYVKPKILKFNAIQYFVLLADGKQWKGQCEAFTLCSARVGSLAERLQIHLCCVLVNQTWLNKM